MLKLLKTSHGLAVGLGSEKRKQLAYFKMKVVLTSFWGTYVSIATKLMYILN